MRPSTFTSSPEPPLSGEEAGEEKFAGHLLLSLNGILVFGSFFAMAFILYFYPEKRDSVKDMVCIIGSCIAVYVAMGYQLYYFKVSATHVVIKNHLFFWQVRRYGKDEISRLAFARAHKQSRMLVVFTRDGGKKRYGAGSLSNKKWTALEERLVRAGYHVNSGVLWDP